MTTVNEKYYGVLLNYIFGNVDPEINDVASTGAYRDMAGHTLVSKKNISDFTAKEKKEFEKTKDSTKKEWKKYVVERIITPNVEKLLNKKVEDFDIWHMDTCLKIVADSCKMLKNIEIPFCYGQAQKWLNMTLKNMLILGKWEFDDTLIKSMHCPVDRHIIFAAKKIGVDCPKKEDGNIKPWSQWNYDDYILFQSNLRNKLDENPIDWEMVSWANHGNKIES